MDGSIPITTASYRTASTWPAAHVQFAPMRWAGHGTTRSNRADILGFVRSIATATEIVHHRAPSPSNSPVMTWYQRLRCCTHRWIV